MRKFRYYTERDNEFLLGFIPGHSYKETVEAFNAFTDGVPITGTQVKSYCVNHNVKNGRDGKFKKGCVPTNKGKKLPPDVAKKSEATRFKKGSVPHNTVPIGTEIQRDDGYAWIKIKEPNVWRPKHVLAWESVNGPVPKGCCVLFLDRDRENFALGNLRCITRRELMQLNRNDWISEDPEVTETRIVMADIEIRINDLSKRKNSGKLLK